MVKIVNIVHCIDTEGPLRETLSDTFTRLKNIYGVKLSPNKTNLKKIQSKKINLNGMEDLIANAFSKKLLNYNDSWNKIFKMLSKITHLKFRNKFKDSFDQGWKYNWFIMDHYGFKKNPRKRTLGIHQIWNKYEKFYQKKKTQDKFYFHHHPLSFSKSANHCSTHYFNNRPIIYEILNKKLIDKKWFPSVYRPGFHTIRPDSHWFLEQFIPFDYSNQSIIDEKENFDDLSNGRFGDWRRSKKNWKPYNPAHDDYQIEGNCRRYTARCLNIGTRHKLINKKDIEQAFMEASKNNPVVLSFCNHDYRNIEEDVIEIYNMIKSTSKKYKNIKFRWCDAREAMRRSLKIKKSNCKFKQILTKNKFYLRSNKPIFGPQPYLAFKTKKGKYFNDNFDIQKPFYEWSYTFDEHTFELNKIANFNWAANDNFGTTYIGYLDVKKNKMKFKKI
jgi:hypothetical protein